jgi:formiminotetrahydrofolate cyclodeaminase
MSQITKLRVFNSDGHENFAVGTGGVTAISCSAGTSGVEYVVTFKNGDQVKFRGNLGYKAMHSKGRPTGSKK